MATWKRRRLAVVGTVAALVAALAVGGCGAGSDQRSTSDSRPAAEGGQKQADAGAAAAPSGNQDTGTGQPGPGTQLTQRSIIYTGAMSVRVDDVSAAASRATQIVTGVGGFVGGDKRSSDASSSQATLDLRVPADRFQRVVDELAGLGRAERRDLTSQDVTEETVDLDARITTQRARVDSGRRLLARANSLTDLVMLEGELAKREADLASLEAKKRRLADLTALSTITVELLGPEAKPAAEKETETGFLAGMGAGWVGLVTLLQVLLTVIGALLPFAVAFGVPAIGVIWLVRRLRRRRPTTAAGRPPLARQPAVAGQAPTGGQPPVAGQSAPGGQPGAPQGTV